jgi:hypothetical protein
MRGSWLGYLLGAVVCLLIALLLAPYIPAPGDHIVSILAWIGAAVCAVLAVVGLVRTGV